MLSAPNPLTHEIAERHLCHNASNINICYKDTGLFGVYFECPKETVSEATEVLMKISFFSILFLYIPWLFKRITTSRTPSPKRMSN